MCKPGTVMGPHPLRMACARTTYQVSSSSIPSETTSCLQIQQLCDASAAGKEGCNVACTASIESTMLLRARTRTVFVMSSVTTPSTIANVNVPISLREQINSQLQS